MQRAQIPPQLRVPDPKSIESIRPSYITAFLQNFTKRPDLKVKDCTYTAIKSGLISGMTSGVLRVHLCYEGKTDPEWPRTLILKANPSDETIYKHMLAGAKQHGLGSLLPLMPNMGFSFREIMSYRYLSNYAPINMPSVYHSIQDEPGDRLWLFLEDLSGLDMLDAWDDPSRWEDIKLDIVMRDLATFHATWWNRTGEWNEHSWLIRSDPPSWQKYVRAALEVNIETHPHYVTPARLPTLKKIVNTYPRIFNELRQQPQTLIHGDCTPRNACLRFSPGGPKFVLYDWALTSIRPPQQDLAKFLLFVFDPKTGMGRIRSFIDVYLDYLQSCLQTTVNRESFHRGFDMACFYYLTVYLTVCAWRPEAKDTKWLFHEFENRLRFMEIMV